MPRTNFLITGPATSGAARALAKAIVATEDLLWLYPLLALAVAAAVDVRAIRLGKAAQPEALLAGERAGELSIQALGRFAMVSLPWTALIAGRFAKRSSTR
jgi:hypothetical protein